MKNQITQIKTGIFHIQVSPNDTFKETLLSKYGFLFNDIIKSTPGHKYSAEINNNEISFAGENKKLVVKYFNWSDIMMVDTKKCLPSFFMLY